MNGLRAAESIEWVPAIKSVQKLKTQSKKNFRLQLSLRCSVVQFIVQ